MRPVRTPASTNIYTLPGGNEDHYLYVQEGARGEIHSDWDLTMEERLLLAGGGRVRLTIVGSLVPPVFLSITRPHCREHGLVMEWDDGIQTYVCSSCETEPA